MKSKHKAAAGAGSILLLLIIILAVVDRGSGFTEKIIDDMKDSKTPEYIGTPDIKAAYGKMTPEILLSFGKLSDPQVSPHGTKLLFGISYTSLDANRSCNNLSICNADGTGLQQLTHSGKSISNARWYAGGTEIMYLRTGRYGLLKSKGKTGASGSPPAKR